MRRKNNGYKYYGDVNLFEHGGTFVSQDNVENNGFYVLTIYQDKATDETDVVIVNGYVYYDFLKDFLKKDFLKKDMGLLSYLGYEENVSGIIDFLSLPKEEQIYEFLNYENCLTTEPEHVSNKEQLREVLKSWGISDLKYYGIKLD